MTPTDRSRRPARAADPALPDEAGRAGRARRARRPHPSGRPHGAAVHRVDGARAALPTSPAAHLARHSFVTSQTMADMVTTLLDRGLIERHRDPADRRRLVISLTPDGQRLLDGLRPQVAALETRMLSLLSPDDAEVLRSSLELCREACSRPPRRPPSRPRHLTREISHQETCTSGFRCDCAPAAMSETVANSGTCPRRCPRLTTGTLVAAVSACFVAQIGLSHPGGDQRLHQPGPRDHRPPSSPGSRTPSWSR